LVFLHSLFEKNWYIKLCIQYMIWGCDRNILMHDWYTKDDVAKPNMEANMNEFGKVSQRKWGLRKFFLKSSNLEDVLRFNSILGKEGK
jgi:hypothetical protein